ncbi:MAG: acetyl-CoA decarbonylase/synthase complex subunit gamma [Planctomycetota bacterium]|nr:MAG: acetyl-CoA decarbonylase/synthase complex subunit gamma [Planctomycetota bacterium]
MALTGLQIFKMLPKSNCKKCGKPTCLAFAMALAQKKASLDECPDAGDETRAMLAEASAPPMRKVKFGTGDGAVELGAETVLYRHEEKFYSPTVIAVSVSDALAGEELKARINAVNALQFDRVGTHIQVNAVAVVNDSGSADTFASAAEAVKQASGLAMILVSESADALGAAAGKVADSVPLLACATAATADALAKIARDNKCPLVAAADSVEALAELTEKIKAAGVEDIVLCLKGVSLKEEMYGLTTARAAALKKSFRPLGYPTLSLVSGDTPEEQAGKALALVSKYAGVVVLDTAEAYAILPVLTSIMNIYTDPQKPVQVEPKVYKIGEAGADSPLLLTTNFSLTYYTVESDAEASRVPCYILVVDTEGTSVLTAYSGDKLNEKVVSEAMKKFGVEDIVKHRKMIIPGYVAVMSGKLEEETGWEILVGPRESSMLPKYLQDVA